ncbi:hypothetical protein E3N88_17481 [Mikania micrantha]|uniref:Uncharacterized protein n=1 Tax=Mikania micrantha TaxID=192012 RepID=A0A5N6NU86_9ASTR|nr:hypothetical protein E3N88_17481 [Mikania micrantha]
MAWEVILWVIFFIMNVALIASNLYQIVCLTDLEADYMNPYDSSARINAVVIPEMIVHGVWCCLFLLTGHWFMFLLALPIMIYNTMLYSKRRHLIDVTEVFRSIDTEKKYRIVKLAFYLLLFVLVIIGMVIAIVNNLIDDDDEVLHGSPQHLQEQRVFTIVHLIVIKICSSVSILQFQRLTMPEARDRLSRLNDRVAETYMPRRLSNGTLTVLSDNDDGERSHRRTPFRWGATPLTGDGSGQLTGEALSARTRNGGVSGRGLFGTPVTAYRRGVRNQNTPPAGGSFRRGRGGRSGSHSVLPSWYPRTPLRDITHVVRAIERRRMHMGDGEGQILRSPIPHPLMHHQTAGQDPSPLGVQLEHEASLVTPKPKLALKTLGKVPLILNVIANQDEGDSELTPQKKLLNSIDIVEKVVLEELNRLKRTPSAQKAEREKKVRTLMSMR